jgi:hypothetical protein
MKMHGATHIKKKLKKNKTSCAGIIQNYRNSVTFSAPFLKKLDFSCHISAKLC